MIGNTKDRFELIFGGKSLRYMAETDLQKRRVVALANYLRSEESYDGQLIKWLEPDTIDWIRNFDAGGMLYDIGANMGIFTIFAAIVGEVSVRAFEPSLNEAKVLNLNVYLNDLSDRVFAFGGCGLSNEEGFDLLHMQKFEDFQANFIGENKDEYLEDVPMAFRQGCFKTTIDQAIRTHGVQEPDYIKIDVDGIEHLVIEGGSSNFEQPNPKILKCRSGRPT